MFKAGALVAVALIATLSFAAAQPIPPSLDSQNRKIAVSAVQPPKERAAANQGQPQSNTNSTDRPVVIYVQEPKGGQTDADAEKQDRDERAQTDGWMIKLTGLIAFAAIVQAIILAITIGTSLKQLRPYVNAVPVYIFTFDATHYASAKFMMQNKGATPAFDVKSRADIKIFKVPLANSFKFPNLETSWAPSCALFPDGELVGIATASKLFEQNELDGLTAGTHGLFVYGITTYQRFKFFRHKTRFARQVLAAEADMRSLVMITDREFTVSFGTVPHHNDAT